MRSSTLSFASSLLLASSVFADDDIFHYERFTLKVKSSDASLDGQPIGDYADGDPSKFGTHQWLTVGGSAVALKRGSGGLIQPDLTITNAYLGYMFQIQSVALFNPGPTSIDSRASETSFTDDGALAYSDISKFQACKGFGYVPEDTYQIFWNTDHSNCTDIELVKVDSSAASSSAASSSILPSTSSQEAVSSTSASSSSAEVTPTTPANNNGTSPDSVTSTATDVKTDTETASCHKCSAHGSSSAETISSYEDAAGLIKPVGVAAFVAGAAALLI
ncbi:unnamed protein product [Ambrosiozyma monospora]|uniref:Unnamed protein product n=1 Tax=Ambrosiozyma monospora TaxID=43982 RepID=A0ACB5T4X1_AMBMO|nr:unnamed protein product [Ambrosiozyma monospora]